MTCVSSKAVMQLCNASRFSARFPIMLGLRGNFAARNSIIEKAPAIAEAFCSNREPDLPYRHERQGEWHRKDDQRPEEGSEHHVICHDDGLTPQVGVTNNRQENGCDGNVGART